MNWLMWLGCGAAGLAIYAIWMMLPLGNPSPRCTKPSDILGPGFVITLLGPIALVPIALVSVVALIVGLITGAGVLMDNAWEQRSERLSQDRTG